jgi:meso-butanediol dehydrogenase/(S,S)-butanediol dehydrogenase/diacetyl reductase
LPEDPSGRFQGSCALITGAASGIGRAVAKRLNSEGAFTHLLDRNREKLDGVRASLSDGCAAHIADVTQEAQVEAVMDAIRACSRPVVDLLINSAGVYEISSLAELAVAEWDEVISINLRGTFLLCQAFARQMPAGKGGAIINISSVAAFVGDSSEPAAHYNASKAGVLGLTTQLAVELAPKGIRVNAVCPGVIDTPMLQMMKRDAEAGRRYLRESVPLGRLGKPAEVADLVAFLASQEASYITGAAIPVDGGLLAL